MTRRVLAYPGEAISHLDSVSEQHIQAALRPRLHGRTAIVIAHRLSTTLAAARSSSSTTGASWARAPTPSCSSTPVSARPLRPPVPQPARNASNPRSLSGPAPAGERIAVPSASSLG